MIDASVELKEIPPCGELVCALLPPAPSFCEGDFYRAMGEFYRRCVRHQFWESTDREHYFSRSVWTVLGVLGPDPVLLAQDINGIKKRYSLYEAFEHFARFSSEDGTASYKFLFYLFKFLGLVCSAGAFVPYAQTRDKTLSIVWRPIETLSPIPSMLNAVAKKTSGGRRLVDLLASAFLNEYVRRRFLSFRGCLSRYGQGDAYHELLNLFFQRINIDISPPEKHGLAQAIDQWLSILHIDFSAYRYSFTVRSFHTKIFSKDRAYYTLAMDITNKGYGMEKIPLLVYHDNEARRLPLALSRRLPEIREFCHEPSKKRRRITVELSEEQLAAFLASASPLLTRLGITVNLPKSLHRELKPRLVIKGKSGGSPGTQGSLVRYLDLNTLHNFQWQVAIGNNVLTPAEFEQLVTEKRALVRFRDGYVKIDPKEFLRLLKKANGPPPDLNDFLKAHFSGDTVLAFDASETIDNLFIERDFSVPAALTGALRPYQKRGYNWICSLLLSGFGCILADDMGLGKTIQSIAVIVRLKEQGLLDDKCLVVAPASLLNNWEKELERFAPALGVTRYHGSSRRLNREKDVFLTTYQTAVRDAEKLSKEVFSLLLVDEAHLMKNAETRIARTVKLLRSRYRLALSGTPVENRLEDLRSLFDFILPGYLGTPANFREQYRIPIEVKRNYEKAETLQKITAPFLLRRLKTDKNIIKDLPEKIVSNEYATLEKNQAALYASVVSESIKKSQYCDSQMRASLILSLLTSLKQICNHPRVFDKESPAVSKLSGKSQLLLTLLQEILANQEKTLVFSQYVETLDCLQQIIKKELNEAPLLYHGGLNQNTRAETVNRFQSDPAARILLVSLRAGGLGLNLTSASRVIHYDLWYNPAVENQATDRAFRIGQERTVFVHRFITKNSFEEKIDAMIAGKKELADMTIASGESWIAQMSHEELKALFER